VKIRALELQRRIIINVIVDRLACYFYYYYYYFCCCCCCCCCGLGRWASCHHPLFDVLSQCYSLTTKDRCAKFILGVSLRYVNNVRVFVGVILIEILTITIKNENDNVHYTGWGWWYPQSIVGLGAMNRCETGLAVRNRQQACHSSRHAASCTLVVSIGRPDTLLTSWFQRLIKCQRRPHARQLWINEWTGQWLSASVALSVNACVVSGFVQSDTGVISKDRPQS